MSSQLHEAVQLAQAGRREEARQLLRQVAQSDPNNEMAWLWLASVAADQAEYQRALNEVLRINPGNQQARQLLNQFQQQVGATAPPPQQYAPPQQYTPPPAPAYQAPPMAYSGQPQPQQPAPSSVLYVQPAKKRGCLGCGCTQACLLLFLVLIVLPALVCGGVSYTSKSLGPGDLLAVYLPGEFGRKTVEIDLDDYTVSVDVPRTWYAAVEGDAWWEAWRDSLNQYLPFENQEDGWTDMEVNLDEVTGEEGGIAILDVSPVTLMSGGAPSGLLFGGIMAAEEYSVPSFECDDMEALESQFKEMDPDADVERIELDDNLCAFRVDSVESSGGERIFEDVDAPDEMHMIMLVVPIDRDRGSYWTITTPENQYSLFEGDIDSIVKSVTVKEK
ncbi:MAG: tetratricopeptide repeat protein [Anaerolineae bacterium]|nr:tetratricopeptide repeat protein [Anaerolineae bacterium]